jgi:hypothetical protein
VPKTHKCASGEKQNRIHTISASSELLRHLTSHHAKPQKTGCVAHYHPNQPCFLSAELEIRTRHAASSRLRPSVHIQTLQRIADLRLQLRSPNHLSSEYATPFSVTRCGTDDARSNRSHNQLPNWKTNKSCVFRSIGCRRRLPPTNPYYYSTINVPHWGFRNRETQSLEGALPLFFQLGFRAVRGRATGPTSKKKYPKNTEKIRHAMRECPIFTLSQNGYGASEVPFSSPPTTATRARTLTPPLANNSH